jgi:predicted ATP-dependent endonuclease of OLD family
MPISEITVENFTAFDKLNVKFSKGINVFIGDNGTGKTHLLKILYAICEAKRIKKNKSHKDIFSTLLYEFFDMGNQYFWVRSKEKKYDINVIFYDKTTYNISGESESGFAAGTKITESISPPTFYRKDGNDLDTSKSVFIPAKEMLTHARIEKDYAHRKLPLDKTLIDIINNAGISTLRQMPDDSLQMITDIEKIIGGRVVYKNDTYYIIRNDKEYNFRVEAEGHKKFALLFRLIEIGMLENDSILFWDEPESNINPKNVPTLVNILLTLQAAGVQIFLATHDYLLSKYLGLRRKATDDVHFHLFSKKSFEKSATINSDAHFSAFEDNDIINQPIELYKETLKKGME